MISIHGSAAPLDVDSPSTDALATAYVVLLIVADATITAFAWNLESNPLVLGLGLAPWLAIKALALATFIPAYLIGRGHWLAKPVVAVGALIGGLSVATNLLVVGGVL